MRFQASALAVLGLSAVLSHAPSAWKPPVSDEAAKVEKLDRDLSAAGVRGDLAGCGKTLGSNEQFAKYKGFLLFNAPVLGRPADQA